VDKIASELKSIRADDNSAIARAARAKIIQAACSMKIEKVPKLNFLAIAQGLAELTAMEQLLVKPSEIKAIIPTQELYQSPEFKMEIEAAEALHQQGKPPVCLSRQPIQLIMPVPLETQASTAGGGEAISVPLTPSPLSATSSSSSSPAPTTMFVNGLRDGETTDEEIVMEGTIGDSDYGVKADNPPSMFGIITRVPTPMMDMSELSG
jgi:hypothetical protein